jgi:hypothetical protein
MHDMMASARFAPVLFSGFSIAKVFWKGGILRHAYLRVQALEYKIRS